MSKEQSSEPLTGKALLKKLDEIRELNRTSKARACGYVVTKQGKSQVQLSEFMAAVLSAKGIDIDPEVNHGGVGRSATYRASVQQNGNLLVGAAYTKQMGLEAGDEFEIKLGYKHIHLRKVDKE